MKTKISFTQWFLILFLAGIVMPGWVRAEDEQPENKRKEFNEQYGDFYTKSWHNAADTNHDGNLSLDEMHAAPKIGPEAGLDASRFAEADKNHDGQISLQEAHAEKAFEIAHSQKIEDYFQNHKGVMDFIIQHPDAANYLAQRPDLKQFALSHPEVADYLASHENTAEWLARHPTMNNCVNNYFTVAAF
ncbi:MAG: hypothetical protein COV74_04345 [Candidatus Omnitrophica bacterium CG11_big_fil_rev_8_21_14_0_20_45_26]|uniref:EF-hand domain-containing protein n=1 Tax=Candidatus Abzuiibacterium crystallinum TaxID=1974748 RepID=A0A2H0LQ31_9BACT|nr:MAG: hypothetical protein COV74_04345 [Candidatus Omnitrophica bacterium CG11_big_fil_rev_8_21_14_0_20_45_26]PIW64259.1 MAG: hypothetical protein COW12_06865 [Candidatus Omnitrophica bacterium CG12_big_fil_rev_8_21_14_0_65_45_16]